MGKNKTMPKFLNLDYLVLEPLWCASQSIAEEYPRNYTFYISIHKITLIQMILTLYILRDFIPLKADFCGNRKTLKFTLLRSAWATCVLQLTDIVSRIGYPLIANLRIDSARTLIKLISPHCKIGLSVVLWIWDSTLVARYSNAVYIYAHCQFRPAGFVGIAMCPPVSPHAPSVFRMLVSINRQSPQIGHQPLFMLLRRWLVPSNCKWFFKHTASARNPFPCSCCISIQWAIYITVRHQIKQTTMVARLWFLLKSDPT